jgi:hypothetical protein
MGCCSSTWRSTSSKRELTSQPQPQLPPQQPPEPTEGAVAVAVAPATERVAATWLISGMLARLSQLGQRAASSRSPMLRSTSKVVRQSLQRYS